MRELGCGQGEIRVGGAHDGAEPDGSTRHERAIGSAAPSLTPSARDQSSAVLVGRSAAMQRLRQDVAQVGTSTATVLITGPTGCGKDNVARALHLASTRRNARFEPLNCGAIPAELAEAELFGAEAGAYTGATRPRIGRFEAASGGTLFLDEVGDLPLPLQVKLLRVLETGQIERLGGTRPTPIDVRIIAATNVDLVDAVETGRFRADLYWRLAVLELDVPPLRAHPEDIPALVDHFARARRQAMRMTDCGVAMLARHAWPGNVRELRNLVDRALALGVHELSAEACGRLMSPRRRPPGQWLTDGAGASAPLRAPATPAGFSPAGSPPPVALKSLLAEAEAALIAHALDQANGTIAEAGRILGMKRTTLTEKMRRMGLKAANEAA